MAGATNRALKAAGIPRGAQKEIRVAGGRGLTLRSAISLAEKHGIAIGDKPKAFLAKRDERMAAMKAAKRAHESPAMARMRDAKARVGELRAARDERRERMGRMRRKVEFARETKAMERAINSPEMRAAAARAEMGYGPNAAKRAAKQFAKTALLKIKEARRYNSFDKNAARIKVEDALDMRRAGHKERQYARLVERHDAVREMLDARSPFERNRIKRDVGYDKSWLAPSPRRAERPAAQQRQETATTQAATTSAPAPASTRKAVRVSTTIRRGNEKELPSVRATFKHKGKSYEVRHSAPSGFTRQLTTIFAAGGGAVRASKQLQARAERVLRATVSRHNAGGKGIRYEG